MPSPPAVCTSSDRRGGLGAEVSDLAALICYAASRLDVPRPALQHRPPHVHLHHPRHAHEVLRRPPPRGRSRLTPHRGRRALLPPGAVRVREDDAPAHDRRVHRPDLRHDLLRDPGRDARRHAPPAQQAQHGDGLPVLRPLAPHDRRGQCRLRAHRAARDAGREEAPCRRGPAAGAHERVRLTQAQPALRGAAAARRARAGACHPPASSSGRRSGASARKHAPRPPARG
jgi:hypothetical protein